MVDEKRILGSPWGSKGRLCQVFHVDDMAVKLVRDFRAETEDGELVTVKTARQAIEDVIEGTRRLQEAGVPVLPVLATWESTSGKLYYAQPWAEPVQWTQELLDEALNLVEDSYKAGVGDLFPFNFLMYEGRLVICDADCVIDPDDPYEMEQLDHVVWEFKPDGEYVRDSWRV